VTTRGFVGAQMEDVSRWIAAVLDEPSAAVIERIRGEVLDTCRRFPVYGGAAQS
jgi:glycine hydroxymethyltransferase